MLYSMQEVKTQFSLSTSTQVTIAPVSAKHVPDTSPTYPVPTIAMFIVRNISQTIQHPSKKKPSNPFQT